MSFAPSQLIRAPLAAAVALVLAGWIAPAASQTSPTHSRLLDVDLDSQPATRRGKDQVLDKRMPGLKPVRLKGDPSNILYSEDFSNCGQNPPVPAPPAGPPYPAPLGLTVHNVDGRTPSASVSYVSSAWIVRDDFNFDISDCVIFSTSWYSPAGAADDWVVLPQITPQSNTQLSWNAVTYDAAYRDGYEVRVSTAGEAVVDFLANPALLGIAAEATTWTARSLSLGSFAGTPIRVAFRNNSNDKFLLLLDDLVIENVVPFDPILLALAEPRFEYAQVPAFLGYQYPLPATVQNGGTQTLTDVVVSADVLLDSAPSSSLASNPIPSLPSGASADVPLGLISFDQAGAWSVDAIVSALEGDDVPNNSVQAADLTQATTQSLRRFEDPVSGSLGIGAGELGELGSDFTIPAAGKLAEAQVAMVNADQSDPPDGIPDFEGRSFRMLLREFDTNAMTPGIELASSTTVFPTGLPLDSVVELTFDFGSQVLSQGRYVLTIEEPVEPTHITLAVTTHNDRFTPGTQWVIWPGSGGWVNTETFGASFARSFGITALFDPVITVPVAANDSYQLDEDGILSADVRGNDTPSDDGGNVWSLVDDVSNGALNFTDGTFSYTPSSNYNGPDSFTYQLCDVDQECSSATVAIQVNPVNDLPLAADDAFEIDEDSTLMGDVRTNDTPSGDGGNVWSLVDDVSNGVLNFTDGTYSYTPSSNYNGPDSFTYQLCDVDQECSSATVTILVNPVNDLPLAADDAFEIDEDSALMGDVRMNDTPSGDGGNVWSLVDGVSNGVLKFSDGTFSYTSSSNYNGPDAFTYQVCDVDQDCSTATVTLTINPVSDLPMAVADAYQVGPGGSLAADVSLNDLPSADGGNVWALLNQPASGTLNFSPNGSFSYTAAAGFAGSVSFDYSLCDSDNDCDQAQATIDVLPTLIFGNGFD